MTWTIQQLIDHARHRPAGYVDEVLAAAGLPPSAPRLPASTFKLPSSAYESLCAKYRPPLPDLRTLALDYAGALKPWLVAGYPILEEPAADARADTCAVCSELPVSR